MDQVMAGRAFVQGKDIQVMTGLTRLFPYIFALVICLVCAAPAAGYEWTLLPDMKHVHKAGTMTVMRDGRVLLIGGASGDADQTHALAEVFDPAAGAFRVTGSMHQRRSGHCSVALADGNVLVAGGSAGRFLYELRSVELYNARTGRFTNVGDMSVGRMASPTCTALPDGNVLIAGGAYEGTLGSGNVLLDRFDISRSTLVPRVGKLAAPRSGSGHVSILLSTGQILNIGGMSDYSSPAMPAAESYDPEHNVSSVMRMQPAGGPGPYAAATLPDGNVILMKKGETTYPEYYDPSEWRYETLLAAGALRMHPAASSITALRGGKILFISGRQLRVFDPAGNSTEQIGFPPRLGNGQCVELDDGRLFCANLENKAAVLLRLKE